MEAAAPAPAGQAPFGIGGVGVGMGGGLDLGRHAHHHPSHQHPLQQHPHHRQPHPLHQRPHQQPHPLHQHPHQQQQHPHPQHPLHVHPHNPYSPHYRPRAAAAAANGHVPHYQPVPGKPREPTLHAPRIRAPAPRSPHVSVAPAAAAAAAAAPQLPPLVMSPRWDSPVAAAAGGPLPSPYVVKPPPPLQPPLSRSSSPAFDDRPPDAALPFAPFQPYSRSATPSSVRVPSAMSDARQEPQTPQSPGPPAIDFDNFSRPRNPSLKKTAAPSQQQQQPPQQQQHHHPYNHHHPAYGHPRPTHSHPALDLLSPRNSDSPVDALLDSMSLHTMGMRSRGPSVSSATTASTFASAPLPRSLEMRDRIMHAATGGGRDGPLARGPPPASPLASSHAVSRDSVISESGGHRSSGSSDHRASGLFAGAPGPTPWIVETGVADVASAARRSQFMGFISPRERASLLVKSGLLGAPHDELSVEDVMSLYEAGFPDTEPEDHDPNDSRPQTAWSAPNRASRSMLAPSPMELTSRLSIVSMARRRSDAGNDDDGGDGYDPDTDEILAAYQQRTSMFPRPTLIQQRLSRMQQRLSQFLLDPAAAEADADADDDKSDAGTTDAAAAVKRDSGKSFESDAPAMAPVRKIATEDPNSRDRYGFKKENQYIAQAEYDRWSATYEPYLDRRRRKWVAYLKENSLMTSKPNRFPPKNNKTKRFVRKGIPPDWRGAAWFYYAGGPAVLAKNPGVYDHLLRQEAKEVDIEAVERDPHRTFPDNIKFKPPPGTHPASCPESPDGDLHRLPMPAGVEVPIIASLRRVLLAFSIHNPRIGYCQSLNFLAGLLLLFVESEEHAFWLLNIITKDFLPGTHELSLEGSKVDLGVLMTSLHESMPAVWAKIAGDMDAEPAARPQTGKSPAKRARVRRRDVPPPTGRLPPITLCMTAWFMSCFIGTLPIETTLRVWDVLFYEGSKTLFRIALAIFKLGENEIESMLDPMEMFSVVQTIPRRMLDANALMEACFRRRNGFGHLSQETTDSRRRERRAQVQLEKDMSYDATGESGGSGGGESSSVRNSKGSMFGRKKKLLDTGGRRPIDE